MFKNIETPLRYSIYTVIVLMVYLFIGIKIWDIKVQGYFEPLDNRVVEQMVMTKQQVAFDRELLIYYVRNTHPIFVSNFDLTEYNQKEKLFRKNTQISMTVEDFRFESIKYVNSLYDIHSEVDYYRKREIYYPIEYEEGKFITKDGAILTHINGYQIEYIKDLVSDYINYENDIGLSSYLAYYIMDFDILKYIGIVDEADYIDVTIEKNGSTVHDSAPVQPSYKSPYNYINYATTVLPINDYLYIKVNQFQEEDINYIEEMYNKYNGPKDTLIIDVTNNPGGYLDQVFHLMNVVGCNIKWDGTSIKRPTTSKDLLRVLLRYEGNIIHPYEMSNYQLNTCDKDLYLLVNEYSYSSSTFLASAFNDSNLGTIIGRTPGSSPEMFGTAITYKLKYSNIELRISSNFLNRYDDKKYADIDIYVPKDYDEIIFAIKYIQEQKSKQ